MDQPPSGLRSWAGAHPVLESPQCLRRRVRGGDARRQDVRSRPRASREPL